MLHLICSPGSLFMVNPVPCRPRQFQFNCMLSGASKVWNSDTPRRWQRGFPRNVLYNMCTAIVYFQITFKCMMSVCQYFITLSLATQGYIHIASTEASKYVPIPTYWNSRLTIAQKKVTLRTLLFHFFSIKKTTGINSQNWKQYPV